MITDHGVYLTFQDGVCLSSGGGGGGGGSHLKSMVMCIKVSVRQLSAC